MPTHYPIRHITWNDYDTLAKHIIDQVRKKNIDYVIPVLCGGSILAMTITNNLNLPICYIRIKRSLSSEPNSDFCCPKYLGQIGLNDIREKCVLICEDTIDSEYTIKEVLYRLQKYHPKEIVIATLYNFSNNNDYICGCKADSHYWVVFPWEEKYQYED